MKVYLATENGKLLNHTKKQDTEREKLQTADLLCWKIRTPIWTWKIKEHSSLTLLWYCVW
jgi:hypothetical protein